VARAHVERFRTGGNSFWLTVDAVGIGCAPHAPLALLALLVGCGDNITSQTAYFDLSGSVYDADTFWNFPFPSDCASMRMAPRT